jgi:hypothetical protein
LKQSEQWGTGAFVGGLVDDWIVSLRIKGKDLVALEIEELLGRPATTVTKRSETSVWILEAPLSRSPNSAVLTLLSSISDDLTVWENLTSRFAVDVLCGVFLRSMNRGFDLSVETLTLLAARQLSFGLDIYCQNDQ